MFNRFCVGVLLLVGLAVSLTGCSSAPSLTSIAITPNATVTVTLAPPGIPQGYAQYKAIGYYTHPDHSPVAKDITNLVTWNSSGPQVATISSTGVATATGFAPDGIAWVGNTNIYATAPGFPGVIQSNIVTFTVTACTICSSGSSEQVASLAIAPSTDSVAPGQTAQFVALATSSAGLVTDVTSKVAWSSTNAGVATICTPQLPSTCTTTPVQPGLATAVSQGTTPINALYTNTDGSVVAASASLTVTGTVSEQLQSLALTPGSQSIQQGQSSQLIAIGTFAPNVKTPGPGTQNLTTSSNIAWYSSNSSIASVTSGGTTGGLVTAKGPGSAVITAIASNYNTDLSQVTAIATVTVTAASTTEPLVSLAIVPASQTSLATGANADVQFIAIGTTSSGATVNLTSAGYTINPGTANAQTITKATWASSNPSVASFSTTVGGVVTPNSPGVATPLSAGATAITATAQNPDLSVVIATAVYTVTVPTVTEPYVSLAIIPASQTATSANQNVNFIAIGTTGTGTTVDLTDKATWSSSSLTVAKPTVLPGQTTAVPGEFTAVANGAVAVTATFNNSAANGNSSDVTSVTASAVLSVAIPATPEPLLSMTIVPSAQTVASVGQPAQFLAIGDFSANSSTPGQQNMANVSGYTVVWYSSNSSVATISNTAPNAGVATAVGQGVTAITAIATSTTDQSSVYATAALTVTGPSSEEITSLTIIPGSQTVTLPLATTTVPTTYFLAIGANSNTGLQEKVAVNWTSSNTAVATISNTGNNSGWATAVGQGSTTITAQYLNPAIGTTQANVVTATATLIVNGVAAEPLLSLALLPSDQAIAFPGQSTQLTAIGTFSTAPVTQNLTDSTTFPITWASSNTAVVTVSTKGNPTCTLNNATPPVCVDDPYGLVKAVGQGTAVITAIAPASDPSDGSVVTGVASISVTNGVAEQVTALTIIPGSLSLSATGQPGQFMALGTSGTTGLQEDVTLSPQLAWTSSIPSYATVCTQAVGSVPANCPNTPGQAQGVSAGTTNITAEWINPATSTTASSVVTAQASVSVTTTPAAEPLLSIVALPSSTTDLDLEGNAQFLAYGTFSTAPTVLDITNGFFHAGFNSATCTAADAAANAAAAAADAAANLPVNNLPYAQCAFVPTTWVSTAPYIFPINSAGTAGATGGLSVADGSGNTDIYAVASNPDSTLVYSPIVTFACPYAAPTFGTTTEIIQGVTVVVTDYNEILNPGTCNTLTIADSLLTTLNVFNAGVNTTGWLITANSATGTVDVIHCGGSVEQATAEGSVCEATYPNGTPVIITATSIPAVNPVPAVKFGGWSSNCVPCTLVGNTCTPIAAPPYYSETGPNWCSVVVGGTNCTPNGNTGTFKCDQSNVSVGAIFN